jgi:hypothetical protein
MVTLFLNRSPARAALFARRSLLLVCGLLPGFACHDVSGVSLPSGPPRGTGGAPLESAAGEAGLADHAGAGGEGSRGGSAGGSGSSGSASSGDAGDGGNAPGGNASGGDGSHADGGTADGDAGATPVGGDAGDAGAGADAGAGGDSTEPTVVPDCLFPARVREPVGAIAAFTLAVTWEASGFSVFASPADSDFGVVRWTTDALVVENWLPWTCFDDVPAARGIAAVALNDTRHEVFFVAADGSLFVRRQFPDNWDVWRGFGLPSTAPALDVAAQRSPLQRTFVYVADTQGVHVRHRTSSELYASYSAWTRVGSLTASRLAAGVGVLGRQQIFALDASGDVFTASQVSDEVEAPFGDFTAFGAVGLARLIDIDAVRRPDDSLAVLAVDVAGNLWERRAEGDGFGPWNRLLEGAHPQKIVSVGASTLGSSPNSAMLLGVLDSAGKLSVSRGDLTGWSSFRELL